MGLRKIRPLLFIFNPQSHQYLGDLKTTGSRVQHCQLSCVSATPSRVQHCICIPTATTASKTIQQTIGGHTTIPIRLAVNQKKPLAPKQTQHPTFPDWAAVNQQISPTKLLDPRTWHHTTSTAPTCQSNISFDMNAWLTNITTPRGKASRNANPIRLDARENVTTQTPPTRANQKPATNKRLSNNGPTEQSLQIRQ